MNTLIKSASYLLLLTALFTNNAFAVETDDSEAIIKACEAEAEGMENPMTYIQQCIEERSATMQDEEKAPAGKDE
ncbi:MAG: hypothetical protein OEY89_01470 [Gammaproteobacteria bacterium]|nr:hypothetical protein [Gammaproteobacteria bacterium]